jgi:nucleoside-diphosphate-sugar epimerase
MTRVVVTGATGNVGTSVVQALSESPQVTEIGGLARRMPDWQPSRTTWRQADVISSDLASIFDGADAVIHLAWAIQPSRDEPLLETINVGGTKRVLDAVQAAGVPKLVYASSVGAYANGPKDRAVDEGWPTTGIDSSVYSRQKAAVERMLDRFEAEAEASVVRLRPALIFKGDAASEIRRLFAGPFLPGFLVQKRLLPVAPRIRGLRFQAVHSADVGQAYLEAVLRDASGAFNLAAEPVIGSEELAELLDARPLPIAPRLARGLTEASWRLRLQPTPPGWLDLALGVPIMDTAAARRDLGWAPRHGALDALAELLHGIRDGRGFPTPPLEEAGAAGRLEELKTGVGARQ